MRNVLKLTVAAVALAGFFACQKPETFALPEVALEKETISAYPGETVTVSGTATAEAGLTSITAVNEAAGLNYSKDLAAAKPGSYSFTFDVTIPATASGNITVSVVAADAAGQKGSKDCTISLVADETAPTVTLNKYAYVNADYNVCAVYGTVSDETGLESVILTVGSVSETITLSGTEAEISKLLSIGELTEGTLTATVKDRAGNTASATTTLVNDVTGPEAEEVTVPGATIIDASGSVAVPFKINFTDDYGLGYVKIGLFDSGWNSLTIGAEGADEEGYFLYEFDGALTGTLEHTFNLTATGNYIVYVWCEDNSIGQAKALDDMWGNSFGKEYDFVFLTEEPTDTEAPVLTLLSANTVAVNTDYKLQIKVTDNVGLTEQWPVVKIWGNFDPWPTALDHWMTIPADATEYTYESDTFQFTAAGEYKVWINAITDTSLNAAGNADVFTITVTE